MLDCDESILKNNFAKKENIMIAKKKGLYLGLLLSVLGISGAMQAYTAVIKNATPYTIRYNIDIVYGKDQSGELGPGHTVSKGIAGYSIRAVTAKVYEKPGILIDPTQARREEKVLRAKPYKASAWKAGGGKWIVAGPIGSGKNAYYVVTREVR